MPEPSPNRPPTRTRIPPARWPFCGLAAVLTLAAAAAAAPSPTAAATARLELHIEDTASRSSLPARVHLRDAAGRPVEPPGLPFWRDHFVCDGAVALDLPPGDYLYDIERGPEYTALSEKVTLAPGVPTRMHHALSRLTDLAAEGWWSGDLHVHRPLRDIERLMRAEDLHVAPVITWWNSQGPWSSNPPPAEPWVRFDRNRFYAPLAGEDERAGGALLYFGLPRPLPLDPRSPREFPPSTRYLHDAKARPGTWADIEKPFWWDVPVWLATGLPDSVGIAHNHLHRGGVLDNEAWGRPRDPDLHPGPQGNGRYTQDLYYRILNAGLRLPPSAGSASGVLPNPVGYNRVYVHLEGEPTWDSWWEGLRAGRSFVSNGPLLRARANGQLPGHVFRSELPIAVQLQFQLDSRDPIAAVELVRNGRIERLPFPHLVTLHESGWFLLRAVADVPHTFRFASTAPWYVEIASPASPAPPPRPVRPVRRDAAQFFLDWTLTRAAVVSNALPNADQRATALEPFAHAQRFWQDRVQAAPAFTTLTGSVIDAATRQPIPSRLYLEGPDGRWHFPTSAVPEGSALRYERRNWVNPDAIEYHTTLSAHPFRIDLPPGRYTLTVERGKEYHPVAQTLDLGSEPVALEIPLRRWIDMAALGWFSGDTHVHRTVDELPNVMAAEDLNVAFPLTHWVTHAFTPPTRGDKNSDPGARPGLVRLADHRVFWPRNTEYEIFTVRRRPHTLGAFFVLGHHTELDLGVPPVRPVAERARREGALLDLDKHNWPWSVALVPLLDIDLFPLANNHHWRTEFGLTNWATPAAPWMDLSHTHHGDERDWTRFTFHTYYALLNAGFRLRPSAGSASGVHPVPLGFGRVYVHLPHGFSYPGWMSGLDRGDSFVTTGPMLRARIDPDRVRGTVTSARPVEAVEIVVNGEVARRLPLTPSLTSEGAWEASFETSLAHDATRWVAVRCWEELPRGRFRYAHTAPRWFEVPERPLQPRRAEIDHLVAHVRAELQRSTGILPAEALDEYREALARLESIARSARD